MSPEAVKSGLRERSNVSYFLEELERNCIATVLRTPTRRSRAGKSYNGWDEGGGNLLVDYNPEYNFFCNR